MVANIDIPTGKIAISDIRAGVNLTLLLDASRRPEEIRMVTRILSSYPDSTVYINGKVPAGDCKCGKDIQYTCPKCGERYCFNCGQGTCPNCKHNPM